MLLLILSPLAMCAPADAAVQKQTDLVIARRVAELRVERLLLAEHAAIRASQLDEGKLLEVATDLHRPVVDDLLVEHARAKLEVDQLAIRYGEKHPELVAARARVPVVAARLSEEVRQIIRAEKLTIETLAAQEEALLSKR